MLRHLVLRLGEVAAVGARVQRERLAAAGIEVRDTPDGPVWLLAEL